MRFWHWPGKRHRGVAESGGLPLKSLRDSFERRMLGPRPQSWNCRGAVSGFACLSPRAAGGHGLGAIATGEPEFARLLDWAIAACPLREVVWTSCTVTGPAKALLGARSFAPGISQRTMRLPKRVAAAGPLVEPYRLAPFDQSRLPSLLATYRAAWPGEDVDEIEAGRSLLEADGLVLAEAGEDVVGYAMWEIVPDSLGLIHEIAVHPNHRRRGIGSALTAFAVGQLRQARRIELLVVGENPAQKMYASARLRGGRRCRVHGASRTATVATEQRVPCAPGCECACIASPPAIA